MVEYKIKVKFAIAEKFVESSIFLITDRDIDEVKKEIFEKLTKSIKSRHSYYVEYDNCILLRSDIKFAHINHEIVKPEIIKIEEPFKARYTEGQIFIFGFVVGAIIFSSIFLCMLLSGVL